MPIAFSTSRKLSAAALHAHFDLARARAAPPLRAAGEGCRACRARWRPPGTRRRASCAAAPRPATAARTRRATLRVPSRVGHLLVRGVGAQLVDQFQLACRPSGRDRRACSAARVARWRPPAPRPHSDAWRGGRMCAASRATAAAGAGEHRSPARPRGCDAPQLLHLGSALAGGSAGRRSTSRPTRRRPPHAGPPDRDVGQHRKVRDRPIPCATSNASSLRRRTRGPGAPPRTRHPRAQPGRQSSPLRRRP